MRRLKSRDRRMRKEKVKSRDRILRKETFEINGEEHKERVEWNERTGY